MRKLLLLLSLLPIMGMTQQPFYGAKFEPKTGYLVGAGQSDIFTKANAYTKSWTDFKTATGITPDLYMDYYPLGSGVLDKWKGNFVKYLPAGAVPQIGVGFSATIISGFSATQKNLCKDIYAGKYDTEILAFADVLAGLKRPVFLRPGLEFDLRIYGYNAYDWVRAYKRFVDLIRSKTNQVAFVWCSAGLAGYGAWAMPGELDKWYPGDAWVDWIGTDWLQGTKELEHKAFPIFFEWAAKKPKPIMIGEFTPYVLGAQAWNPIFVSFFKRLIQYPQIKSFNYINWDWKVENALRYDPGWGNWGNAILTGDMAKRFATAVKSLSIFVPPLPIYDTTYETVHYPVVKPTTHDSTFIMDSTKMIIKQRQ